MFAFEQAALCRLSIFVNVFFCFCFFHHNPHLAVSLSPLLTPLFIRTVCLSVHAHTGHEWAALLAQAKLSSAQRVALTAVGLFSGEDLRAAAAAGTLLREPKLAELREGHTLAALLLSMGWYPEVQLTLRGRCVQMGFAAGALFGKRPWALITCMQNGGRTERINTYAAGDPKDVYVVFAAQKGVVPSSASFFRLANPRTHPPSQPASQPASHERS